MMREDWIEVELGDMLDYIQPSKYIVNSTEYSDNYRTPVLTAGKSFIIGYTNETEHIFNDVPVIIFDDFTTATQFVNFHFKVKSSAMKILKPTSDLVNIRYVFYFMKTIRENTDTHKRYWISIFSKVKIPLAPLPEQRAIAAKIEQLFSELDNGIANLKAAKSKLEIYRQAILKQAFEGELTIEWRQKRLLEIEDWKVYKFGDLIKTIDGDRGKNYPKSHELLNSGFCLFLSTKNVRKGEFVFDENQFISEEKDKILRGGKLEINDVVITTRGTLGNVALYDERVKFKNVRVNSGMLILRVKDSNQLSQNFLMQFINSSIFFRQLKAKQSGTAQPQIPANVLREIEINLPSEVTEQNQIVQEIETRLSVCDKLNEAIDQSLEKAQALRQSILKKAFEGKLLTQDEIQTCRQQPDWEPAAKLLERVKKDGKTKK